MLRCKIRGPNRDYTPMQIALKLKHIILIIFSVYILTGCHFETIVEVSNNTGENIVIVSYDTKLNKTFYNVKSGTNIQIGIPSRLEVRNGADKWTYNEIRPVSGRFVKKLRPNTYIIRFQIRANRGLYLDLPDTGEMAQPQPVGYPISPE